MFLYCDQQKDTGQHADGTVEVHSPEDYDLKGTQWARWTAKDFYKNTVEADHQTPISVISLLLAKMGRKMPLLSCSRRIITLAFRSTPRKWTSFILVGSAGQYQNFGNIQLLLITIHKSNHLLTPITKDQPDMGSGGELVAFAVRMGRVAIH